jgi:hypothetical protein
MLADLGLRHVSLSDSSTRGPSLIARLTQQCLSSTGSSARSTHRSPPSFGLSGPAGCHHYHQDDRHSRALGRRVCRRGRFERQVLRGRPACWLRRLAPPLRGSAQRHATHCSLRRTALWGKALRQLIFWKPATFWKAADSRPRQGRRALRRARPRRAPRRSRRSGCTGSQGHPSTWADHQVSGAPVHD